MRRFRVGYRMSMPSPTVVIVAFRSRWCLPDCLRALARTEGGPPPVLVVENGCPERSAEGAEDLCPGTEVLRLPRNLGFAEGANEGIRRALALGAGDVLLLNPDTLPEPGWLAALREAAAERPDAGLLGSLLLDGEGARVEPLQARVLERSGVAGEPSGGPVEVSSLIGAALWIRAPVLREVGAFDPLFFMYGEETDLCVRARARGYRLVLAPRSRVRHFVGGSARGVLPRARVRWWWVRNDGLLLLKRPHLPLGTCVLDLPFRVLRRGAEDLRGLRLLDFLYRCASLPALLLLLPAVRRSREAEAAGPAHLGPAPGAAPPRRGIP